MFKKLLLLTLTLLFCMIPINVSATEHLISSAPQKLEAVLVSDTGETFNVTGEKINTLTTLYNANLYDEDESATYKFTLYSNQSNSLTASEYDGSRSVEAFLTINYKTQKTPTEYLLTSVSGHWNILDQRVSVTNAELTYGCSGATPFPTTQIKTRNVSNNFYYSTGFSNYVTQIYGNMGANLNLDLQMGSARRWNLHVSNNLF
ncbi:hypothetical protein RQN30_02480 [Arcanobacterium hippocoleae]